MNQQIDGRVPGFKTKFGYLFFKNVLVFPENIIFVAKTENRLTRENYERNISRIGTAGAVKTGF